MSYELQVIDPGLMELGGHHAGFATTLKYLLNEHYANQPASVTVYTHQAIDKRLERKLTHEVSANTQNISINGVFKTNFYQLFEKQNTIADANVFISKLACEYFATLSAIYEGYDSQLELKGTIANVVFFYPCLSWEHANALTIALSMLDASLHNKENTSNLASRLNAQHVICAMYNPGLNHKGLTIDVSHRVKFFHGFQKLVKHPSVRLFASDKELACQYQQLLNLSASVPIHPCYLHDWGQLPNGKRLHADEGEVPKVLLYNGDAKLNKGISLLPGIIETLQEQNSNVIGQLSLELTVQYTLSWQYPEIADALKKLQQQSEEYKNLTLCKQFWSQTELIEHIISASIVLLPYSAKAYSDKSSGFLWLCGALNKPVVILGESWLSREAERLGIHYTIVPMKSDVFSDAKAAKADFLKITDAIFAVLKLELGNAVKTLSIESDIQSKNRNNVDASDIRNYRGQLYGSIFEWFAKISTQPKSSLW